MNIFSKTKLIATYGPSLDKFLELIVDENDINISENSYEKFLELQNNGVDVIRFNMSHETMSKHKKRFEILREFSNKSNIPLGILIDTKGPEIRVGNIQDSESMLNKINLDQLVVIYSKNKDFVGNGSAFSVSDITGNYNIVNDLAIGDEILIDDGKLILKVTDINSNEGIIKAVSLTDNYVIKKNKRLNLFNKKYSLPFLSEYDIETIKNAVLWDADFLALSFLSNTSELVEVKKIIYETKPDSQIKIICKVESYEAVQNLELLVQQSDGIMVARGDLSLEIGYELVPIIQDKILSLCNSYNKISIVATQMLDSLEIRHLPTRAEVTDCYYAVKSLTDATMLSSESASGVDPINAIKVMKKITNYSENNLPILNSYNYENSFYQTKEEKKLIKKLEKLINGRKEILLKGFNIDEVRIISSTILNVDFYISNFEYKDITKFTLFKNLNVISSKNKNIYIIEKW